MSYFKRIIIYIIIVVVLMYGLSYSSATNEREETKITNEIDTEIFLSKKIKAGDELEFGRFYDLNSDDEIERVPIKWMVLDRLNEYALLITKDIIKTMPYNYLWSPTNWRDSNIRLWLNYDFYDIAFNDIEKMRIRKVITENVGNHVQNVISEFQTNDYVFLLSIEEAKRYFKYSKDYRAVGTEYAKKEGLWISKYETSVGYSVWWLRSPGRSMSSAAIVYAAGGIGYSGDGVATRGNGLRPCIWVECS